MKAAAQAQRACLSVFRRGGGSSARLAYSGIPSGEPTTKKAAMNYRHESRQVLKRARAALESNDDQNLKYAALELRMGDCQLIFA